MNHLYLAAVSAQHAAKWQPSHAEVSDIRIVGAVALPLLCLGLIRTIVKGRQATPQAAAHERMVRAEREFAGYEAD